MLHQMASFTYLITTLNVHPLSPMSPSNTLSPDPCRSARAALMLAHAALLPRLSEQVIRYRIEPDQEALGLAIAALKLCSMPKPMMCGLTDRDGMIVLSCGQVEDPKQRASVRVSARDFLGYMDEHRVTRNAQVVVRGVTSVVTLQQAEFGSMLEDYSFLLFMNSVFRRTTPEEERASMAAWLFEARPSQFK